MSTLRVWDSVFDTHPSGYGIEASGLTPLALATATATATNCVFRANGSGAWVGLSSEGDSVFPSADPFANAGAEDWAPNNAAGAGAMLRGAGEGGVDLGAVQHVDLGNGVVGVRPRSVSVGRWRF